MIRTGTGGWFQIGPVAPCSGCGAIPLDPAHRLRAREDQVCAERVADVLLMYRLLDELRRSVPPWRPDMAAQPRAV